MERKYNINEIITRVGDIAELISQLNTKEPVPFIEIDIILDKIRRLYADISNLKVQPVPAGSQSKPKEIPPAGKESQAPKEASRPAEIKQEPEEPATLADKYKGEKKFINESLGENGKRQDVSSKLQSKPIQDIGTALGLNDRFKLINELFNGDKASYQQTIDVLDNATNFNEAFNYISESYDWDMEDDSVQMLLDLVRRKFIVNKNE